MLFLYQGFFFFKSKNAVNRGTQIETFWKFGSGQKKFRIRNNIFLNSVIEIVLAGFDKKLRKLLNSCTAQYSNRRVTFLTCFLFTGTGAVFSTYVVGSVSDRMGTTILNMPKIYGTLQRYSLCWEMSLYFAQEGIPILPHPPPLYFRKSYFLWNCNLDPWK